MMLVRQGDVQGLGKLLDSSSDTETEGMPESECGKPKVNEHMGWMGSSRPYIINGLRCYKSVHFHLRFVSWKIHRSTAVPLTNPTRLVEDPSYAIFSFPILIAE
eukprot:5953970-Pyramimonas_sp.AAC.2